MTEMSETDIKIRTFPLSIAYCSGFKIFKQKIGMGGKSVIWIHLGSLESSQEVRVALAMPLVIPR